MWTTQPAYSSHNGLAVARSGQGPTILLIHGVGLRMESWNGLKSHLSNFEVICIDLPGHGKSDDMGCHITDVSKLTAYLKEALETFPHYMIGHSLGALVALDWACKYKEGLKGVIALNAIFERTEEARLAVIKRAEILASEAQIDPAITLERWFGTNDTPERQACETWLCENRIEQYAQAYGIFARSFGADRKGLKNLHIPSFFLTGSLEPNSTPEMSHKMAKLAPHGQSYIIEGAAHMAPMTHAAQIADNITRFIRNCENRHKGN